MHNIKRLTEILVAEVDLAQTLLEVVEQKQDALVHMNVEKLVEMVDRERTVLQPTRDLEKERIKVVADIASSLPQMQSARQPVAVGDLLQHVDTDSARTLSRLRERFRDVATRIRQRNQQNSMLLEHSARFVKSSINILTDNYSLQLVDRRI